MFKSNINSIFFTCCGFGRDEIHRSPQDEVKARAKRNGQSGDKILSLTVQKRKTSRISSVYAGFETFFIVNRYAYVAPSFWKNRMKGARARLSLIPGAEFSTRAYLSYKRLSYFFVCLHMFLIFAIGINSFEVSNPKAWCRESVSSLRL